MDDTAWLWLLLLGALHGVNPGMGWLFAVALGLQERSGRAVWRALLPLAIGHALAIAAAILIALAVGLVIPSGYLKWIVAAALLTLAVRRLVRHRHPRWGGMQVGMRDLAIWSLLMASAHGAGLMVLPVLLSHEPARLETVHAQDHSSHAAHMESAASESAGKVSGLAAALVHTAGYLFVTGLMAVVVFYWAGLKLLRTAWINLDLIWAGALIVTALLTPVL
jgi:hypothetical protein